jgi:hypothetical protein
VNGTGLPQFLSRLASSPEGYRSIISPNFRRTNERMRPITAPNTRPAMITIPCIAPAYLSYGTEFYINDSCFDGEEFAR